MQMQISAVMHVGLMRCSHVVRHGGIWGLSCCSARRRSTRSMTSVPEVSGGRTIGKGLRHFSMKVCEKVESKGRTTYNEVADELVKDYSSPETTGVQGQAENTLKPATETPYPQPSDSQLAGQRVTSHVGFAPPCYNRFVLACNHLLIERAFVVPSAGTFHLNAARSPGLKLADGAQPL